MVEQVGEDRKSDVHMRWSPILHQLSILAFIGGVVSFVGAWIVAGGGFWTHRTHLFNDATVLTLLSISLVLGTIIHREQEKRR